MTTETALNQIMQATASDAGNSREAVRGILKDFRNNVLESRENIAAIKAMYDKGVQHGRTEARKPIVEGLRQAALWLAWQRVRHELAAYDITWLRQNSALIAQLDDALAKAKQ